MLDENYLVVQTVLSKEFDLFTVTDQKSLVDQLSKRINQLIENDFTGLVNTLYRIDVDESKLKETLRQHPGESAGHLIANMIIDRHLQKMVARKNSGNKTQIDDNEKW
jgi:hypothetical protein